MNMKKFPGIRRLAGLAAVDVYADDEDLDEDLDQDLDEDLDGLDGFDSDGDGQDDEPVAYSTTPERIQMQGLRGEGDPELPPMEEGRGCVSKKLPLEFLAFDTCVTPTKNVKRLPAITSSRDVAKTIYDSVKYQRNREFFSVLCLDSRNRPIGITTPHVGGRSTATVEAAVVLQAVVLVGAQAFIIAHNHPSGETVPSSEDVELTRRIYDGAKLLGLRLLDHIILSDDGSYFSFLDRGVMPR